VGRVNFSDIWGRKVLLRWGFEGGGFRERGGGKIGQGKAEGYDPRFLWKERRK